MAKKKKVRIRIDRLIILVLALIVILTGLGLFTSRVIITPMRLRSLGYNSQSIKAIRKNKATSEILKAGKCSLLVEALNDDPNNITDYTVYLIKDEQLDKKATTAYQYIRSMKSNGYDAASAVAAVTSLSDDDCYMLAKAKYISELKELVANPNFELSLLPRYLLAIRNNQLTCDYAVEFVNSNSDYIPVSNLDFASYYKNETALTDQASITALVNKQFYMSEDYQPADLVTPKCSYTNDEMLRREAADAFDRMSQEAVSQGYDKLICQSNYRSYEYQQDLYNKYVSWYGQSKADSFCSRPGFSEHQTGLAADLGGNVSGLDDLEDYVGYQWVLDNSYKYGIIQRYPLNKEYITGVDYESWHFRYVGIETAKLLHDYNWTLEEYKLIFN